MRPGPAAEFLKAIDDFSNLLTDAKRRRVSLLSHASDGSAIDSLANLGRTFRLVREEYPAARYPAVEFETVALRPLVDGVVALFPAKLSDMITLVAELRLKAKSDFAAAIEATERVNLGSGAEFLPEEIIDSRHGVFRKILWEANRCYNAACYNACAILIRRLIESLIVEAFESRQRGDEIQDADGDYLGLQALIGRATTDSALGLTRNTKRALPGVKFFGDMGAHSRKALVRRDDLDRSHDDVRGAIEELNRAVVT